MEKSDIFAKELTTIINEDIREFARALLDDAPDYFYVVAASSSGKYHPKYALGNRGLVRHTKAVLRILNHILALEQHQKQFSDRHMDLMRVACLYHDAEKQGTGETGHTVFEHPFLAANTVRSKTDWGIPVEELEYIAEAIESHMGQWNVDKKTKFELPKPSSPAGKLIHLADYLASRKDIEIQFSDEEMNEDADIETYVMPFGKHKGELLKDIAAKHIDYLYWLRLNTTLRPPLKNFVEEFLKRV